MSIYPIFSESELLDTDGDENPFSRESNLNHSINPIRVFMEPKLINSVNQRYSSKNCERMKKESEDSNGKGNWENEMHYYSKNDSNQSFESLDILNTKKFKPDLSEPKSTKRNGKQMFLEKEIKKNQKFFKTFYRAGFKLPVSPKEESRIFLDYEVSPNNNIQKATLR